MRITIDGEYTMFEVAFKDFIKHKVFFADAPSHTADMEPLGDVKLSYDASMPIPMESVKNPDKDLFRNEVGGTIKVEMTGKNEDLIHLKSASLTDLSEYDYLVYYVYSNYDGYFGSIGTLAHELGHAYMLVSSDDEAVKEFFTLIATTVFCDSKSACMDCNECNKILHDNHPDVVVINKENNKNIVLIFNSIVKLNGILFHSIVFHYAIVKNVVATTCNIRNR